MLKSKGGAVSRGCFRHLHLRFGFEFQKYLLCSWQLVTALKKKSRELWIRCTRTFLKPPSERGFRPALSDITPAISCPFEEMFLITHQNYYKKSSQVIKSQISALLSHADLSFYGSCAEFARKRYLIAQ